MINNFLRLSFFLEHLNRRFRRNVFPKHPCELDAHPRFAHFTNKVIQLWASAL